MKRSWNANIWIGFFLLLAGAFSYPLFFARFPATRDIPWANLAILALALILLGLGIARAFRRPDAYRGKIFGSILGVVAVALAVFFCYGVFYGTRETNASHGAPQVGQVAPDFTLPDSQGNLVTLSSLLTSPFAPNGSTSPAAGTESGKPAGSVLIFYRGYW
ncbi:MAG TPA: hypothetical protein VI216_15725 [Candidatus Acidoferrales bacterium]